MIGFKKDVKKILSYDRDQYNAYLIDDLDSSVKWYGVSFQLVGASEASERDKTGIIKFVDVYQRLLEDIILEFNKTSLWIVNHESVDLKWFPNNEDNLTSLRTLFAQNDIPYTFKGALIFPNEDLLRFSTDLISYPIAVFSEAGVFYKNLDISHNELQFIIKISDHLNVDLLSTDQELLKKVVDKVNSIDFVLKQYTP